MTVLESERAKTRSTATASGACSSSQASMPCSIVTSRSATGSSALVRSTLTSTSVSGRPTDALDHAQAAAGQAGVDPEHPHDHRLPGPNTCSDHVGRALAHRVSTRRSRLAGSATRLARPPLTRPAAPLRHASSCGHHLVGDVEVGEDVLHVVEVLERLDQAEHLRGARPCRARPACRARTAPRRSRSRSRRPAARCGRATRSVASEITSKASPRSLTSSAPASSVASRTSSSDDRVPSWSTGHDDDALAVEQEGHRARVGQRAAVAGHRGADLHRGAVAVVGEALDEHRDAGGAVALVHDRLVVGAARPRRPSRA